MICLGHHFANMLSRSAVSVFVILVYILESFFLTLYARFDTQCKMVTRDSRWVETRGIRTIRLWIYERWGLISDDFFKRFVTRNSIERGILIYERIAINVNPDSECERCVRIYCNKWITKTGGWRWKGKGWLAKRRGEGKGIIGIVRLLLITGDDRGSRDFYDRSCCLL